MPSPIERGSTSSSAVSRRAAVSAAPRRVRVTATVHGRVQMVGFRAFVLENADGLQGSVANRPDGTVRCIVEGDADAVESLVTKLHDGPAWARVDTVDVVRDEYRGDLPPFTVSG